MAFYYFLPFPCPLAEADVLISFALPMTLRNSVMAGFLCAVGGWGQSLHVPVSEPSAGGEGVLSIELDSPQPKGPTALQWEVAVPAVVAIEVGDLAVGKAAQSAGKSLNCGRKKREDSTPGPTRYVCILAGGTAPIPSGAVAEVHYRVREDPDRAPIRVGIENALAVFLDLTQVKMPDADAVIKVR